MTARFIVGIDLGTTNTVVASAPASSAARPAVLPIMVRTDAGMIEPRSALRSSLYAPIASELVGGAALPFPEDPGWIVGELAARRGSVVPRRYVASAKSWLCHPGVDHHEAILPWGVRAATTREDAEEDQHEDSPSLSPVDASSRILAHLRGAWDSTHPDAPLHLQDVVLTVPASFDEVARELTLEAAQASGLTPRLLEEPQAAFYAWLDASGAAGLTDLLGDAQGVRVLVIDVGGGTTDLSLLRVARDAAAPDGIAVTRAAVGRHLLLGGDNMDLALAMTAESRMTHGARLDPGRFSQLVSQCKAAKEVLLAGAVDDAAGSPSEAPIALAPRGSALVGATLRTTLTADDARSLVLEGFFPVVARDEEPVRARGALVSFGLPYERDPAITRHVAAFVARHAVADEPIDALLFNGGVFRAARLAARMVDVVASWQARPPRVLRGNDPDLAVALGAVAYGASLRGRGRRIESRSARGYYVGLGASGDDRAAAICVVPRGGAEGARFVARAPGLSLTLGRPARFDLWSSDVADDPAGAVVELDPDRFQRTCPLLTRVGAPGEKGEIAVQLEGEINQVGTLELSCVEVDGASPPRRFRLAFDLRAGGDGPAPSVVRAGPRSTVRPSDRRLEEAGALLEKVYGKAKGQGDDRDARNLLRDLEKVLGDRTEWPTDLARQLADRLLPLAKQRRRSADHERVYFLLLGFCLRPGFGFLGDEARVAEAFKLFNEKVTFSKDARGIQQFWIAWRRIAGGLDERAQTAIRDELDRHLAPHDPRSRKAKPPRAEAEADLIEMLSWLERVPPARRAELGGWLLERTWTDRDPRLRAALGRLGAREPAYASAHHVIAPRTAERWIDHLLREKWNEVPAAARAAFQIARVVGDRARDLADTTREEVATRLASISADPRWIESVRELAPHREVDRRERFGEDLPSGLSFRPAVSD